MCWLYFSELFSNFEISVNYINNNKHFYIEYELSL